MTGTAYGLGVGPGDPDLITVKALRVLRDAPVLAYPAPDRGEATARTIVAPHLPGTQTEIPIRMPMVASRFPAREVYDWAARELAAHLASGRDVAVLCEGDPFFYGSFMYLFARLAEQHRVEVVPGVSSLTACAAVLGAPLASRDDVLCVVPATLDASALRAAIAGVDAAAIIKVGRHLDKVIGVLEELELADRARYVEHATMASERCLDLTATRRRGAPYFSMILVHKRGQAWR